MPSNHSHNETPQQDQLELFQKKALTKSQLPRKHFFRRHSSKQQSTSQLTSELSSISPPLSPPAISPPKRHSLKRFSIPNPLKLQLSFEHLHKTRPFSLHNNSPPTSPTSHHHSNHPLLPLNSSIDTDKTQKPLHTTASFEVCHSDLSMFNGLVVPVAVWGKQPLSHVITSVLMMPGQKYVVTGCDDGHICVWNQAPSFEVSL